MREWVGDLADTTWQALQYTTGPIKHASQWQTKPDHSLFPSSSSSSYHDNGYFIMTLRLSKLPCWLRTCRALVHLLCNHLKTCQNLFLPPLYRWDNGIRKQLSNLFQEINRPQSAAWKPWPKCVWITYSITIWQRMKGIYAMWWVRLGNVVSFWSHK